MGGEEQVEALEREVLTAAEADQDEALGEVAGSIGGGIGGGLGGMAGGRIGGGAGARRGAKLFVRMRALDRSEASVDVDASPDRVLEAAREIFQKGGRKLVNDELPSLDPPEVWGVIHGGTIATRPVLVRVAAAASARGTTATVRTAAVEGLVIKQQPAQKAAPRVRDELADMLGGSP